MATSNMEASGNELDSLVMDGKAQTLPRRNYIVKLGLVVVAVVTVLATTMWAATYGKRVKAPTELISKSIIPGYCTIMRTACNAVFSEAVDNEADCQLLTAEANFACEAPWGRDLGRDPLAYACAADMTGTIEAACTKAVKAGQSFGTAQCDDAVGCGCKNGSVADGGKCTDGQDTCCENGAACGRYDNSGHEYQCCNNYALESGQAWCQNGGGGACSDGNDDNCASDEVCGRYNNQDNQYQCCSQYQEVDGVAWCANSEGAPCSDGEDSNCLQPMACGVWADSTSGYACCSDYTTPDGAATCSSVGATTTA